MESRWILSLILLFFNGLFCIAPDKPLEFVEESRLLMDTVVRIVVYDQDKPKPVIHKAIQQAFQTMQQIENSCSVTLASSEISTIYQQAGKTPVMVSRQVKKILSKALDYARLSNGAFDPTIFPVLQLWNFSNITKQFHKPTLAEIQSRLVYVNYQDLKLDSNKCFLKHKGMAIDVGGIAKGHAIDLAFYKLIELGMTDVMLDAGGDLRIQAGEVSRGKRRIWIKHPRQPKRLWGFFKQDTCCVATSGDYERYFVHDSVRYHHILNPQTGFPARKCVSVTTVAKTAMQADALSTAIFVMGPEKGLALAESLPNVETVILFEDNQRLKFLVSQGLRNQLQTQQKQISEIR